MLKSTFESSCATLAITVSSWHARTRQLSMKRGGDNEEGTRTNWVGAAHARLAQLGLNQPKLGRIYLGLVARLGCAPGLARCIGYLGYVCRLHDLLASCASISATLGRGRVDSGSVGQRGDVSGLGWSKMRERGKGEKWERKRKREKNLFFWFLCFRNPKL